MGCWLRNLLAGGICHVYNWVSRGEHVFHDEGEADELEALLAAKKKPDDFHIVRSTAGVISNINTQVPGTH